ncbi:MAG TPA: hypothetical protein VK917_06915 [Ilumatobacter sp.]|nr:hypothetical protein [Ilumatobacter sp.]
MEPNTRHDAAFPDYMGHMVVDEHDQEIGTVVDVTYDDASGTAGSLSESPSWLVVDPGLFKAAHWVPVAGTYRSASGNIVVPWDRELVKHSPKAADDHRMTPELERELSEHYEVATRE